MQKKIISQKRKNIWRQTLLDILDVIGSREFQKRVWIKGEGPEVSDYGETACIYFDDLRLDEGLEKIKKEGLLTKNELSILSKFHYAYDKFLKDHPHFYEKFTLRESHSKEWIRINELTKETYNELGKL